MSLALPAVRHHATDRRSRPRVAALASLILAGVMLAAIAPVNAETITGNFTFLDGDGSPAPIRHATVEVWRKRMNDLRPWEVAAVVDTDAQGRINATVQPYGNAATSFGLRIYAMNRAVALNVKDNFVARFYSQPGPPGAGLERASTDPNAAHDFSWHFTDDATRLYYNAADAMLRGLEYAEARRDPREAPAEPIGTVTVQITSTVSYYDPVVKVIRLNADAAMSDFAALHEYAHFLQERISGFTGVPSTHDGCSANAGAVSVATPEHAWMEGLANYFSQAARIAGNVRDRCAPRPARLEQRALRPILRCRHRHRSYCLRDFRPRARHRTQPLTAELRRCLEEPRTRSAAARHDLRRQQHSRDRAAAAAAGALRFAAGRQSRRVAPLAGAVVGDRRRVRTGSRVGRARRHSCAGGL
jgi:hypothetical protein